LIIIENEADLPHATTLMTTPGNRRPAVAGLKMQMRGRQSK
jgi:hypothetical protein